MVCAQTRRQINLLIGLNYIMLNIGPMHIIYDFIINFH